MVVFSISLSICDTYLIIINICDTIACYNSNNNDHSYSSNIGSPLKLLFLSPQLDLGGYPTAIKHY